MDPLTLALLAAGGAVVSGLVTGLSLRQSKRQPTYHVSVEVDGKKLDLGEVTIPDVAPELEKRLAEPKTTQSHGKTGSPPGAHPVEA
jgi:hypothetical protein